MPSSSPTYPGSRRPQPQRREKLARSHGGRPGSACRGAEGPFEHIDHGLEGAARGQLRALELEPHVRAVGQFLVEGLDQA